MNIGTVPPALKNSGPDGGSGAQTAPPMLPLLVSITVPPLQVFVMTWCCWVVIEDVGTLIMPAVMPLGCRGPRCCGYEAVVVVAGVADGQLKKTPFRGYPELDEIPEVAGKLDVIAENGCGCVRVDDEVTVDDGET